MDYSDPTYNSERICEANKACLHFFDFSDWKSRVKWALGIAASLAALFVVNHFSPEHGFKDTIIGSFAILFVWMLAGSLFWLFQYIWYAPRMLSSRRDIRIRDLNSNIVEMEETRGIMPFDLEWQNTTYSWRYKGGNSVSYPIILHSRYEGAIELDVDVHLISGLENRWINGGKMTVNPASSYTEHLLVGLPKTIDNVVHSSKIINFYCPHIPNSEFRWMNRPLQLVWRFSHPDFTSKEFSLYICPLIMVAKLSFGQENADQFEAALLKSNKEISQDDVIIQFQRPEHWVEPKSIASHGVKYEPKTN